MSAEEQPVYYIDRVAGQCVNKLSGFDVYIWAQCYAMEAKPAYRVAETRAVVR